MEPSNNDEVLACPYLRPESADRLAAFPLGVYCRLPHGRVRIPSRDELARFCTTGHYADCVGFRRARYLETNVSGLA
ncbi:MAG: hypothetical protein HYY64_12650 [Candidatus Rokubacteria bacterium]|nr:hypothetical protein [Candidatus Rokubacteria bacterium]